MVKFKSTESKNIVKYWGFKVFNYTMYCPLNMLKHPVSQNKHKQPDFNVLSDEVKKMWTDPLSIGLWKVTAVVLSLP